MRSNLCDRKAWKSIEKHCDRDGKQIEKFEIEYGSDFARFSLLQSVWKR